MLRQNPLNKISLSLDRSGKHSSQPHKMMSDNNSHNHHIYTEKMQRCQEYVEGLQEELRKIQVFHRELPLCLQLVTQAIEACKQQLCGTTTEYFHEQSECFEHTSSQGPVLEEFIPIKRPFSFDQSDKPKNRNVDNEKDDKSSQKSNWLKSVQLWNQTLDPPTKQDSHSPKEVSVMEVKRNGGGGAFHPFNGEKSIGTTHTTMDRSLSSVLNATATASSTGCNGGAASGGGKKEGKAERKARRCWSPELHRSFLHALQQLGSPDVATPKQIRELMKVDGLTNDEVKSHLQKYRLHTRRPIPSIHNNNNPQAPQFVVVGGIWIPPPEYKTVAASGEASGVATTNRIYAPIAAPLPPLPQTAASQTQTQQQHNQFKQFHSDERLSHHSEDGVHSNSPATSSSTHTTTASHAA